MRIASLVPSSTEMLFALGLGDSVVAVTHECDYPPQAAVKPQITRSVIPAGLGPAAIDAAVRERTGAGEPLYELDEPALAQLDAELIVTQAVCEVCAVSYEDVRAAATRLPSRPEVISLDPSTVGEVLADVERLAVAAGVGSRGGELRSELEARLARVRSSVEGAPRPRVLALEWLDPPFVGGHWVPEMVEIAGGENALGETGGRSRTATWEELCAADPGAVVSMPCGYDAGQAAVETEAYAERIAALGARAVWAVDAAASFSRPGPRLVDGVELLAHLLHPDRAAAPSGVGFHEVAAKAGA